MLAASPERSGQGGMKSPGSRGSRFQVVDVARGAAIIGVVIYHFAWDLSFLGFTSTRVGSHPLWVAFARTLAGSFMVLVGFSLVLAHRRGIRWRAFCRRLAVLIAAAAGITLATYLLFPGSFIFFGILHSIAAASLLALPFLRAPPWLVLASAVAVWALPNFLQSPSFNTRALAWIGFAAQPPPSNDLVPVFPWFALTLVGVLAARLTLKSGLAERMAKISSETALARLLAWSGRRSLEIYLLHQPVLLALLYPIARFS